jgi:anti-anti-sigma regulatory factor
MTLRITIEEDEAAMELKLEGRVAGPWAAELSRVWMEEAPRLASRKLLLDLRSVTYADADGTKALREIYALTHAEVVTGTPWTQFLAEQIAQPSAQPNDEEL